MITVVGSINLDIIAIVDRHPHRGETVLAVRHHTADGGKGANQAVAAARLGADVEFIGCVGDDAQGEALRQGLQAEGVGVVGLRSVDAPSGTALIVVDADGENTIVVAAGANARAELTDDDRRVVSDADVVLCQLEIPLRTVVDATDAATGPVILNAAPARPLPSSLWPNVDYLIVNEHELEVTMGNATQAEVAERGLRAVITTLGASGARVVTQGDIAHIPAPSADVQDTTGAGDAFCGAFAASVHDGLDVFDAAARAVHAGSVATTRMGARAGMPSASALEKAMERMRR